MTDYRPQRNEPFISHDEVKAWLDEATRHDPCRRRYAEAQIFRAVCWLFVLVALGYGIATTFGMI